MPHSSPSVESLRMPSMVITSSMYSWVTISLVGDTAPGSQNCRTDLCEDDGPLRCSSQIPGERRIHGFAELRSLEDMFGRGIGSG